jgi:hypothetical protein
MVSISPENRISITQLAQREQVNTSTVWRWTTRGVKGTRLTTFAVGGRRYTSPALFDEFVAATTAAATGCASQSIMNGRREASVRRAEEELAKSGI